MTPRHLLSLITLLSAAPAGADELVDRADANGDGYVSLYELRAAYFADAEFNRRIEESFAAYDTDGDGLISEAERRAGRIAATAPAPDTPAPAGQAGAPTMPTPAAPPRQVPADIPSAVPPATPATATEAPVPTETDGADATGSNDAMITDSIALSRSEQFLRQVDTDASGGASMKELIASGDGQQWFPNSAFTSADRNSDGDLDADELEALLQSMEQRGRGRRR